MASRRRTALPLAGVLVADFSRVLAAPLCTQLMADAGARVIKVEEPGGGDETRRWGPPFLHGESAYFLSVNRGKESIALNLKTPGGASAAARLIERADVVIDNFLPAQREVLGLTAERVRALNPRSIHCSISGYDSEGPSANVPGYDLLAQAESGLMAITGEPDGEAMKAGVALSDVLTAHYAFGAIVSALFARERSGLGERIEVSLFAATVASLVNVAQNALVTRREAVRYGNAHASIVPYQVFHASDRSFVLGAGTDRHFRVLCEAILRRPELAVDRRFATNRARVRNRAVLLPLLAAQFATKTARTWIHLCRKAAVPAALVQGVREALQSGEGRRLVTTIDHPVAGTYEAAGNPLRLRGERLTARGAPPLLGQHTDAILRELGFTRREIARMHGDGAVGGRTL
ncbi:MAG TPA: CoA transferase [Thermoanaerobaculia bacterium]|nr:CoA transferase [Thermoanaerobaculia bacterium]